MGRTISKGLLMTFPFVRLGALAILGFGVLGAGAALAQTAKPAPGAPPQGGGVKLDLVPVDANWTKVCNKDPAGKENCVTGRVFGQSAQQPSLTVMIYQTSGEERRFARFNLPVGLLLRPGFRVIIDKGEPIEGHYVICFQGACIGEADLSAANLSALKKGSNMAIVTRNSSNYEVTFNAPVKEFGAAFDGPSVDPKVIEQQNAELQKQLEEKAKQQREMLEKQQSAAPAAPAAPAATPAKP
jgi:invasion protein IalB